MREILSGKIRFAFRRKGVGVLYLWSTCCQMELGPAFFVIPTNTGATPERGVPKRGDTPRAVELRTGLVGRSNP